MERNVKVLSNKGSNAVTVTTSATTLGELKSALDAAGINYGGMSFFEGISKTELLDNASILPSNLLYKGEVTNDLVILLTVKDKKITSGGQTRSELYSTIKGLIALYPESANIFNEDRNYTNRSSSDLSDMIERVQKKYVNNATSVKKEVKEVKEVKEAKKEVAAPSVEETDNVLAERVEALEARLANLIDVLVEDGTVEACDLLEVDAPATPKVEKEDYESMFHFVKK